MNHDAAPAPPPRGLLIKSAGLLTAISPLCTWLLWDTLPASALLAILSSLLLLTLAAAYACLLCIGKKTTRPAAGKTQATA